MHLCQFKQIIEQCWFALALGDRDTGRKKCLEAVKLLNSLENDQNYKSLSKYVLELYETIKDKEKGQKGLDLETSIVWLNSKLRDEFYYPKLEFGQQFGQLKGLDVKGSGQLDSGDAIFLSQEPQTPLLLPETLNLTYQEVVIDNWAMEYKDLWNLHQDLLSNCSFVSSFLSLTASNLIEKVFNNISPHGPSSTYAVTLRFNGCERVVVVDNKLPILEDPSRFLTIRSSSDLNLFWPALVEKAYLKVMGKGYTIDGSNMAFDTLMLTGWIPEIVKIKDGRIPTYYKRLIQKHFAKDITVGLGTGKLSKSLSEKVGLVSHHDYTLFDFDQEKQSVVLKNPWLDEVDKHRIVELSCNDLFYFNYFYVNWNPCSLFEFSDTVTFINPGDANIHGVGSSPQFGVTNTSGVSKEVWFFLERFFVKPRDVNIAVDIYNTESGDKVIFPKQYNNVWLGDPTNARTDLVRFTLDPNTSYTVIIHATSKCSMKLTMYSNDFSLKLVKAKVKYPKLLTIEDEWDFTNSGGNKSLSSYVQNPQFNLTIEEAANLLISVEAQQTVSFDVFYWNQQHEQEGIRQFAKEDLLFEGEYTNQIQSCSLNLQPGYYRIVCSTREPKTRQKFELKVYYDTQVHMAKVNFSLGLFLQSFRFGWNGTNRHKVKFAAKQYASNFCFHIKHSSNNFAMPDKISDYRPRIRGSVFNLDTQVPVLVNEQWEASLYGIFVDCTIKTPGNYVLLVERFEPGTGTAEIDIGCNNNFQII